MSKISGRHRISVVLVALFILLNLTFPFVSEPGRGGRSEARAGTTQLASALKNYYTEYGYWPDFTEDGKFLDAERNARLMHVLTANDEANNPRKIAFFESKPATQRSVAGNRLSGGFDPATGTFLDSWGNPYRIILDSDYRGVIPSPYSKDPEASIHSNVIVWSLGKDGKQGAPKNDQVSRDSDDICSWR